MRSEIHSNDSHSMMFLDSTRCRARLSSLSPQSPPRIRSRILTFIAAPTWVAVIRGRWPDLVPASCGGDPASAPALSSQALPGQACGKPNTIDSGHCRSDPGELPSRVSGWRSQTAPGARTRFPANRWLPANPVADAKRAPDMAAPFHFLCSAHKGVPKDKARACAKDPVTKLSRVHSGLQRRSDCRGKVAPALREVRLHGAATAGRPEIL